MNNKLNDRFSLLDELTYLKLRLSMLESKSSGDSDHTNVTLAKEQQKVAELKRQLQEKDEILKEAELAILQLENKRMVSNKSYESKIEQLENRKATNDKLLERLQKKLEYTRNNFAVSLQKVCTLENENFDYQREIHCLKDQLQENKMKNMKLEALLSMGNDKLNRVNNDVKDLRLHFKMCDEIAQIKLESQGKVIDKLNSELNERKDTQQSLLKIIFDYQSSLKSKSNEMPKTYRAYDSSLFWQTLLRDHKAYELRLINIPRNLICHCNSQMSYMPQVHLACRGVPRRTHNLINANIDCFSKALRICGLVSIHGVKIGAFIYIKYLNIGHIDDSMRTLNYLKSMSMPNLPLTGR